MTTGVFDNINNPAFNLPMMANVYLHQYLSLNFMAKG